MTIPEVPSDFASGDWVQIVSPLQGIQWEGDNPGIGEVALGETGEVLRKRRGEDLYWVKLSRGRQARIPGGDLVKITVRPEFLEEDLTS